MIPAIALMCAVSSVQCQYPDAHRIATAIDAATDSDELRAQLVVSAWHESGWHLHPKPVTWDSQIGLAVGPWQMWNATTDTPLVTQARAWLWQVQRGGYPNLCGYGSAAKRHAYRQSREAERLLTIVTERSG